MPQIALATCSAFPRLDTDDRLLLGPLEELGIDAQPEVWDDRTVDWSAYDAVLLRSTWDYTDRHDEFLAWASSVPRLLNPPDVVRWNTDKRYIAELGRHGVPMVPTTFLTRDSLFVAPNREFVVKPVVSAGSRDTARYGPGDGERAHAHVRKLLRTGRMVMVQPYVHGVDSHGETAIIAFGGVFSHCVCKGPLLRRGAGPTPDLFAAETITPREPSAAERAVAERVLAALPFPAADLVYARVDLLPGPDGPLVLEVELTEPSLFLGTSPGAAARLARAVASRLAAAPAAQRPPRLETGAAAAAGGAGG